MIRRSTTRTLLSFLAVAMTAPAADALTLLTEENPPFNYTEKGKVAGLSTEVVSELGKRAGITVQIQSLPWGTAYVATQANKETCLYSTARLENRERLFFWIGPIANDKWVLIGRSDFAGVNKVEDARKFRVGVVGKDAKIEYLMAKGVTDLREVEEDRLIPPRLMLKRDDPARLDLWATSAYGARQTAARANLNSKDLKMVLTLHEVPLYLACGRNTSPESVQALTRAFEQMQKEGSLKRIARRYER